MPRPARHLDDRRTAARLIHDGAYLEGTAWKACLDEVLPLLGVKRAGRRRLLTRAASVDTQRLELREAGYSLEQIARTEGRPVTTIKESLRRARRARAEERLMPDLRGYQARGAAFLAAHRRALLGDSMGLGKTAQAVAAADLVGAETALVGCPASVRPHWVREFAAWSHRAWRPQI